MFENLLLEKSSWEFLKETPLPIAVYGTGNGADRVFDEFEKLGIKVSFVVASDGFVRQRTFRGFPVKGISQLEGEIDDFIIVLAFASPLPDVINNIKSLSTRHKVIMPSVPVFGDNIFNKDFLKDNIDDIEKAYSLLCDEKSKQVFKSIIRFQITGNLNYCFDCETDKDEAFKILKLDENESFLDLGAYRGDTVKEFLHYTKSYEKIVAVEPDKKTFRKLESYCENLKNCTALNNAVWNESTELFFDGNKGRGSSANAKGESVFSVTVDDLREKYGKFTYLNIDVEGSEKEMLEGSKITLQQDKPKICMAVYHRSEDIFALVNKINKINGDYKIYLRHFEYLPAWDTNFYFI